MKGKSEFKDWNANLIFHYKRALPDIGGIESLIPLSKK